MQDDHEDSVFASTETVEMAIYLIPSAFTAPFRRQTRSSHAYCCSIKHCVPSSRYKEAELAKNGKLHIP